MKRKVKDLWGMLIKMKKKKKTAKKRIKKIKSKKSVFPIIIDRDTGNKLSSVHDEVSKFLNEINDRFNLNYYEMIGVLETIIFLLHDSALAEDNGD